MKASDLWTKKVSPVWAVIMFLALSLLLLAFFSLTNRSSGDIIPRPSETSSPFTAHGTPVGMVLVSDTVPVDVGGPFSMQATVATNEQLQMAGLSRSSCPGTYWYWQGRFEKRGQIVLPPFPVELWYAFGPQNYWCSNLSRTKVLKVGWSNIEKHFGGVYDWDRAGSSRSHGPFGLPYLDVYDTWHYVLTVGILHDGRTPGVDYRLYPNGRVAGTVYLK